MKTKDTLILVQSKLKIRKLRTTITIITASILFGVIIAVLFIAKGFFSNLTNLAKTTLGDNVILSVGQNMPQEYMTELEEKATELYNLSDDENKQNPIVTPEPLSSGIIFPPYLDEANPFATAAAELLIPKHLEQNKADFTDQAKPYNGQVIDTINNYHIAGQLFIEGLTSPEGTGTLLLPADTPGAKVTVVNNGTLDPFIKITEQKDYVIQIIIPLEHAIKLIGKDIPTFRNPEPITSLENLINAVNQQALGLQFIGTLTNNDATTTEITYEIVGLLPPKDISTLDPYDINPIIDTAEQLQSGISELPFVVTNPHSTAFKAAYDLDLYLGSKPILVSFPNIQDAENFMKKHSNQNDISIDEFMGNRIHLHLKSIELDAYIIAFTVIFSIIATIIMIGTIARIIDDERQTIALYRTVGATTKNILQVFTGYIFTLSTLIAICSTIIGLTLAAIITATHTDLITANVSALYNIPNLQPLIFIAFDSRILIIIAIIIVVGLICLLLTLDKLISKNIVRDLRK